MMINRLAALTLLATAGSASATTYAFEYRASTGVISGLLDGALQSDANTVFLFGLAGPLRFNGATGAALPLFFTASELYGVPRQAVVTLDGSRLDFAACTDINCADGVVFDPDVIDVTPIVSTGVTYGEVREAIAPGSWSISAVVEPRTWVLLVAGFGAVGVASRRRARAVAA